MPFRLSPDFPIVGAEHVHSQGDAPIQHLHIHDCLEIGYCHEGSGVFVVEEKVLPFRAGDVSVIGDREYHLARSAKGTRSIWTFLLLDPARLIGTQGATPGVLRTTALSGPAFQNIQSQREHPELSEGVKALICELRERRKDYREAVRALVWLLLIRLHRLAPGAASRTAEAGRRQAVERLAPALSRIATGYAEPLGVGKLAECCQVSETHLRRLFRDVTGRGPKEYLNLLRLRLAMTMLSESSRSILDVSLASGFQTLSSFNRQFRRELGVSPRQWRRGESRSNLL